MEPNRKKSTVPAASGEECQMPGPSSIAHSPVTIHRESAAQSSPLGLSTTLKVLDVNSADEVRQAVKSVLNDLNESKVASINTEGCKGITQGEDKPQSAEHATRNADYNTLFDIVKMTMELINDKNNKRGRKSKSNENRKKRRNTRRLKAVPRKKGRYDKIWFGGKLSNVSGMKRKGHRNGVKLSSNSGSDISTSISSS